MNLLRPPCVLFEDDHLLVVNKPAGLNTHAPAPFAGEGIYDWLRHREPRWAALAIIHRLDKETSGLMVFGKTPPANRSLTDQFTRREVQKKYLFLTDRKPKQPRWQLTSHLQRAGERYVSRPGGSAAARAETQFCVIGEFRSSRREEAQISNPSKSEPPYAGCCGVNGEAAPAASGNLGRVEFGERRLPDRTLIEARPLTGRTHQIRVHAAESGCPILGDELYGGSPAPRVCLHAAEICFQHPETGAEMRFESAPQFDEDARLRLRRHLINGEETNAFRLIHGAADDSPGRYVDVLGDYLLAQTDGGGVGRKAAEMGGDLPIAATGHWGLYHKILERQVRRAEAAQVSPRHIRGPEAPDVFVVRENGVRYELGFREGYSVGLFLDQRDNRRRFLTGHVAAGFPLYQPGPAAPEVLNVFAYTCAFSVCAALGGARATSLDLSKKYLAWGRRNFALNGLDPARHDFIYGDAFDWLKRLGKKARRYAVVVLDPPTFSQSKERGLFRAEKDYGQLAAAALPLLQAGGVLLASTNAAGLAPEKFLGLVEGAIGSAGRGLVQRHYAPQPPDFPITRAEPGYLKTVWLRVG